MFQIFKFTHLNWLIQDLPQNLRVSNIQSFMIWVTYHIQNPIYLHPNSLFSIIVFNYFLLPLRFLLKHSHWFLGMEHVMFVLWVMMTCGGRENNWDWVNYKIIVSLQQGSTLFFLFWLIWWVNIMFLLLLFFNI